MSEEDKTLTQLTRIADALERLAPAPTPAAALSPGGYVWEGASARLAPAAAIDGPPLSLLRGLDHTRDEVFENLQRFAAGAAANNMLLWGARGTGKSAPVKAAYKQVAAAAPLALIEVQRDEIASLPALLGLIRQTDMRCVLYCDDLSFETPDTDYKALKAVLEGGLEGRPANVLFVATSNRKHLTPRKMSENEDATAIRRGEAGQESLSLADRFGLSLGFYPPTQDEYLAIVAAYAQHFALEISDEEVRRQALAWAAQRGARSGRTAWQFIQDVLGRAGRAADF